MWATSDAFDEVMVGGHIPVAVKADLYTAGLTEVLAADLLVVGGSVTADRTAQFRRQCQVQLADSDGALLPLLMGVGGSDPGAAELVLQRGVGFPNGTTELIPLGVFSVSIREVTDTGGGVALALTGYDRSRTVSRAKLLTTYYIAAGTKYLDAAVALVDNRLPFVTPVSRSIESVQPTTTPTSLVYHEQDDPWARVQELCAAVGCEVFFEVDGALRIRDIPDPTTDPVVFEFVEDSTSLILSVGRALEDEPGYNAVIVTGESSANVDAVPRAIAYDNDPTSPTYFFGPYGQVPEFFNDPLVTNNTQAATAATGRLRRIIGLTETVNMSVVPHPALAPSDVIRVVSEGSGLDRHVLVEALTVPLDVSTAATLATRVRRTV
jgi:hypothetical protein